MKCKMCGKEFIVKRHFRDLFRTDLYGVCDECFKKHPYDINYSSLPLHKNYTLDVVSIFKEEDNVKENYDGFIDEYSHIYEKLCKEKKPKCLILMDSFNLNEDALYEFEEISKVVDSDITILTNTFKG